MNTLVRRRTRRKSADASLSDASLSDASLVGAALRAAPSVPHPPVDAEVYRYIQPHRIGLLMAQMASVAAILWSLSRFAATDPLMLAVAAPLLVAMVGVIISVGLAVGVRRFDVRAHERLVREAYDACAVSGQWPSVDVYLPTCGEDLAVLDNTFGHLTKLRWPGALSIWVLDDAQRPEVERLAVRYGLEYLARPDRGVMKKAGNLRYAFARTEGELIAIFDADFSPRDDFLIHTFGYMQDPEVAIVQTPQYFDVDHTRQGWLERGAGAVQEYFYRWVQPVRNRRGGAICVGSCGLYRRSALAPMGGTALIEHSEDVHTGFSVMSAGYRVHYIPVVLAKGLCPDALGAFVTQQYRWCAGSMSLLRSRAFWAARIGLGPRLCFVSGFAYYIMTALSTVLLPLPAITLVWFAPDRVRWESWLPLLPATVVTFCVVPLWHTVSYGLDAFSTKHVYGWSHLLALRDTLRGRLAEWRPTGAVSGADRARTVRRAIAGWLTLWVTVLLVGVVVRRPGAGMGDVVPLGLFTLVNATVAVAALRDTVRAKTARFPAS